MLDDKENRTYNKRNTLSVPGISNRNGISRCRKCTEIGNKVEVDVRGRKVEAEVIALPFYKRAK